MRPVSFRRYQREKLLPEIVCARFFFKNKIAKSFATKAKECQKKKVLDIQIELFQRKLSPTD